MIKITETPRDGMQGLNHTVPTEIKVKYINKLLECGFDTIEAGSFVSPKAIPRMADTGEVLTRLERQGSKTKIAVLVANKKGGDRAVSFPITDQLFYPYSLSPTFLKKNLNTTLSEAESTIDYLQNICIGTGKELVVFISLAFGDPYGDPWNEDLILSGVERLSAKGLNIIPLADTIGDIGADKIYKVCSLLVKSYPEIEFGLHTHALPGKGIAKVEAAYRAGIRRFDTVLGGLGGCPMTGKEMISNLDLRDLIKYCLENNIPTGLDTGKIKEAEKMLPAILLYENF